MSKLKVVHGQPSYHLHSSAVDCYVTRLNGNVGPITFNGKWSPMHVTPWAENPPADIPKMLQTLRGDFFCLPFGANSKPFRGRTFSPHGETANRNWSFVDATKTSLHLKLDFDHTSSHGRESVGAAVNKHVSLIDNHPAVYQRHILRGFNGPMNPGHHAMLRFNSPGIVSTSPIEFGQVYPYPFEDPTIGGYSSMKAGAKFDSLHRVPMNDGSITDATKYPARSGFEDLLLVVSKPQRLAWSAVTFPKEKYVWFALKDPAKLHFTLMWFSNGGRHYHPWNGRHRNVLGIEDVTSYFHTGLAESASPNELSRAGFETVLKLSPKSPTTINYIIAAAKIPPRFDEVAQIEEEKDGVTLIAKSEKKARVKIDVNFLYAGS